MLRKQNGISVYTVLSIILLFALIFILALPNFYNLDKEKNIDDCINSMKQIWVGTTDYMQEHHADFTGTVATLANTPKLSDPKVKYLNGMQYCPETARQKNEYIVYGKYVAEQIGTETKHNFGVIVLCPNLAAYPKHIIPKNFYENMNPTQLQNYMIEDLSFIDDQTGTNGARKLELCQKYIELWKNDPTAFEKRKADNNAMLAVLFPEKFAATEPAAAE